MTEATITHRMDVGLPGCEMVVLEASNGETFVSKFKQIDAAFVTHNMLTGFTNEEAGVSISAQTATINTLGSDTTDNQIFLVVFGRE